MKPRGNWLQHILNFNCHFGYLPWSLCFCPINLADILHVVLNGVLNQPFALDLMSICIRVNTCMGANLN